MTLEQQIYELETELRCCELTHQERKNTELELTKAIEQKAQRDAEISGWSIENRS